MIRDDYEEIGASIGRLVQEKQAAYGDSFNRACEILRVLYPEGITPDKYRDFLAVTRVIDKLFRIATDKDAFGESPWKDVMGYALLSVAHKEDSDSEDKNTTLVKIDSKKLKEAFDSLEEMKETGFNPTPYRHCSDVPETEFRESEIMCTSVEEFSRVVGKSEQKIDPYELPSENGVGTNGVET